MKLSVYRYDPDKDARPYMQDYEVKLDSADRMLLDALVKAKMQDDSLSFPRTPRTDWVTLRGRITGAALEATITNIRCVRRLRAQRK